MPHLSRGASILLEQIVAAARDDGCIVPFRLAGEVIEAGCRLLDFADAFPGLLAGEAGKLAEGAFIGSGRSRKFLAEDADQPVLVHHRGEDQEA